MECEGRKKEVVGVNALAVEAVEAKRQAILNRRITNYFRQKDRCN